jgi:hypothetical protein
LPLVSQALLDRLRTQGAMFAEDLQLKAGLLRPQLEQAWGRWSRGLVTADAFSALRWLIRPEDAARQLNASNAGSAAGDMLVVSAARCLRTRR